MKQHKIDSEAREIRKQKALKTISKKLWKALITKVLFIIIKSLLDLSEEIRDSALRQKREGNR